MMKILGKPSEGQDGSRHITDQAIIDAFITNPDNPFLVSFPRTGSHWLRLIMELYFERPSLVRVFYYPEKLNFLTFHTHDIMLEVECRNVIYLYRDPVDTVYSQLNYHKEPLENDNRILYWSDLYAHHLDKWLFKETFTTKKTTLTYEGLKTDIASEFSKVTRHFGQNLNRMKLETAISQSTKEEVSRKTKHDSQVVQLDGGYGSRRQEFREDKGTLVWSALNKVGPHLKDCFRKCSLPES